MRPKDQALDVWGDFACFTRPEMKVERFSYPVITPSAARGIYDAIYCKPNKDPSEAQFRWQVTRIEVLAPPRYIALRRNEVKDRVPSAVTVAKWMKGSMPPEPIWADASKGFTGSDQKGRTQRQTMALKDVRYRLHAEIHPWPGHVDKLQSLEAQFRRRAAGGKCVWQPYFGCREFPAYFELVEPEAPPAQPYPLDTDLGLMLYDVFDLSEPQTSAAQPSISLFVAKVERGVLNVPDYNSPVVFRAVKEER